MVKVTTCFFGDSIKSYLEKKTGPCADEQEDFAKCALRGFLVAVELPMDLS